MSNFFAATLNSIAEEKEAERQFRIASMRNKAAQMSHDQSYSAQPYSFGDGISEAWAAGVRSGPGAGTVALVDEFSPWASLYNAATGNTLQGNVDAYTGADQIEFNPEDYGTNPYVLRGVNFLGEMLTDPVNALAPAKMLVDDVPRFGKSLLSTISDDMGRSPMKNQRGMITWQGSPHKYDGNLDPTKIGTGEGAQAYGYGHYLAENPAVSQNYRATVPVSGNVTPDKRMKARVNLLAKQYADGDYQGLREFLLANKEKYGDLFDDADDVVQFIDEYGDEGLQKGFLYKFDLDDNAIANMLDWDAPLSEQPESVLTAYKQLPREVRERIPLNDYAGNPITGGNFYNSLSDYFRAGRPDNIFDGGTGQLGQFDASAELKSLGIPGIKYYDGSSRAAGEGTRNFVVFPGNEHLVKALERNGEPL